MSAIESGSRRTRLWIAGAENLFYIQNLFAGILSEDWS
jgi:hypothetical protein